MKPMREAELVSSKTNQPRMRNCIPLAHAWALAPIQNQRKSRCRSARKVWSLRPMARIWANYFTSFAVSGSCGAAFAYVIGRSWNIRRVPHCTSQGGCK